MRGSRNQVHYPEFFAIQELKQNMCILCGISASYVTPSIISIFVTFEM